MLLLLLGSVPPLVGAAAGGGPSDAVLASLTYRGVLEEPVRLQDGRWLGEPFAPGAASRPRVELARNGVVRGDLDGDGRDEAAVLLLESSGGTGLQHHVAVVAGGEDAARNVDTVGVGDRIQVMRFAVEEGRVVLDAVEAGPDDPMCCPTLKMRRRIALQGEALAVEREPLGPVGVEDLGGRTWSLTRLDVTEGRQSDAPITLSFEEGRLAGSAGCNRYGTELTSRGGQQVEVGAIAATRKMCPPDVMADEQGFLARLGRVERFGFVLEDLALSYRLDGRSGTLFFEASEENE
jgi:heat shock protein HslJ